MGIGDLDFSFDFGMGISDPNIVWESTPNRNRGRPIKVIDKRQFEFLVASGYNETAAAEFFKVSDTKIQSWLKSEYGEKTFKEVKLQIKKKLISKMIEEQEKRENE